MSQNNPLDVFHNDILQEIIQIQQSTPIKHDKHHISTNLNQHLIDNLIHHLYIQKKESYNFDELISIIHKLDNIWFDYIFNHITSKDYTSVYMN